MKYENRQRATKKRCYTYITMENYSKETLLYWLERYNNEEDFYNTGLEQELRNKFQKSRQMTLEDLKQIVDWKFQALPGRRIITFNLLTKVDNSYVQNVSKLAFKTEDDKIRLTLLSSITGVGYAISSVILAFYDPNKYGVLDIHIWRELFGSEPKDLWTNPNHTIVLFQKFREISADTALSCRDIEKALFQKNFEESK